MRRKRFMRSRRNTAHRTFNQPGLQHRSVAKPVSKTHIRTFNQPELQHLSVAKPVSKTHNLTATKPPSGDLAKAIATLEAHGVKSYGVSWCGWSIRQRDLLSKYSPQNAIYQEDVKVLPGNIQGFPTWVVPKRDAHRFGNNTHLPGFRGEEQIQEMASKF